MGRTEGGDPHSPPAAHHLPFLLWQKNQKNKKSWKPQDNEVNSRKWKRQQARSLSASQQVRPKSCWQLSRATLAGCPQRSPNPSPATDGSPERPSPAAVASKLGRHPVVYRRQRRHRQRRPTRGPRDRSSGRPRLPTGRSRRHIISDCASPRRGSAEETEHSPRGQRHLQRQQLSEDEDGRVGTLGCGSG